MISIVIPVYNEADTIGELLQYLNQVEQPELISEIIVVDGGSTDSTLKIAESQNAQILRSPKKGRAAQLNYGAQLSKATIIYFLHADSFPPKSFVKDILNNYHMGNESGCYRLAFDYSHWFLRFNCWFSRFDVNAVRFGDQSLYITREVFEKCGGFHENLIFMEDQEIIHRIKNHTRFILMPDVVTTSARKYLDNGIYRMQGIFFIIFIMYYTGFSQNKLLHVFRKLVKQDKV